MSFTSDSYNTTITELKGIDRAIQNDIKEFKINANTTVNTFNIEKSISKNLENYINKSKKLQEEYEKNETQNKKNLSSNEFARRRNEIQEFINNYDKNKSNYNGLINIKYRFVIIF